MVVLSTHCATSYPSTVDVMAPLGLIKKSNKEDSVIQVRTEDGPPIPRVPAIRVLGLHIQETQHNNVTVQKLQAKLTMTTTLLRRESTRHQGMRYRQPAQTTQSFAIGQVAYVAAFHNWKTNEMLKIYSMIRKTYKTALGLYAHTNTERMLALGIHNTLEEITEAQRTAQYHRLAQTKTGRAILHRIGLNTPATTPKEGTSLPETVARRLRIPPLPKHMHPQVHQDGKREPKPLQDGTAKTSTRTTWTLRVTRTGRTRTLQWP